MIFHLEEAYSESIESQRLVQSAFALARSLSVPKLILQADELSDVQTVICERKEERLIWLTRRNRDLPLCDLRRDVIVHLPDTTLTRMSQLKIGLLLAVMQGHLRFDESVVCLSGVAGSERLDTLLVTNVQRDFPWFPGQNVEEICSQLPIREFARLLDIALQLASQGREGHPIGTIFVLGEPASLAPYLRQLILNPCSGHAESDRSIHRPEFFESIRELSALDGAFVVDNNGIVQSAGTYLDAETSRQRLAPGFGARHAAALAITAVSNAVAIVVSSSSGTVSVFHEARTVFRLEKSIFHNST